MKFIKINETQEMLENELLMYLCIFTESLDLLTFDECSNAIEVIQEYMPKLNKPRFADTQRRACKLMMKLIKKRRYIAPKIYRPAKIPPNWIINQDPTWELTKGDFCE